MKAAGIIRIIVGLVIAVLLTAILVVLLTGNNIFSRFGWNNGWVDRFLDRTTYSSGGVNADSNEVVVSDEARVPASDIQKIKVDWTSGSVNVRVGTGSDIVFSESSYRSLTDRQKMRYSVSDSGVLEIHFCEDFESFFGWFNALFDKSVEHYSNSVSGILRKTGRYLVVYVIIVGGMAVIPR